MTIIKHSVLLKNLILPTVILVNCCVISIAGRCNDYKASAVTASNEINAQTASIAAMNAPLPDDVDYQDIEMRSGISDVAAATTAPTQQEPPKAVPKPVQSNGITNESFTVFDLNTRRTVTLNGYDLICQIVRNEVGAHYTSGPRKGQTTFEPETIKAFAVAAYTYVKYNTTKGRTPSVGLRTDYSEALKKDVAEVYGQAIYYDKQYICAVYCASTGGSTTSSANSWGKANPYLVGVESKYDNQGKQYKSTKTFSADQMKQIIEGNTNVALSDNPANWLSVAETVDGNYVTKVLIDGHPTCVVNSSEQTVTGTLFRNSILGAANLRSTAFTITYDSGTFYITSYGYGHGVGMPAEGAQLYAINEKWNYVQILKHYYTGVEVR